MPCALRRQIHGLGAIGTVAYAALAVASYAQAPVLWPAEQAPRAAAFYASLPGREFPPLLGRLIHDKASAVAAFAIPLAVASLVAFLVIRATARRGSGVEAAALRPMLIWPCVFAAVCVCGLPAFTQDFWLSAVWGRMIAGGANPYETLFTPAWTAGLPLDHFPIAMTYGPLWGLAAAAVAAVAQGNVLLTAVLLKLLLAAAWGSSLLLVVKATAHRPPAERLAAVAAFGWTPLGVTQFLLEGHNDIAMAAFALLWLHMLGRGRLAAPLALAASALCKFVTAPLFLVDIIDAVRRRHYSWGRLSVRLLAPGLLLVGGIGLFLRSSHFFDGLKVINDWHFLRPVDAVKGLEAIAGFAMPGMGYGVIALAAAITLWFVVEAVRRPGPDSTLRAAVALMAGLMFGAATHFWPWYAIWLLAPAVLIPGWWLSRYAIGLAVLAPFTLAFWWLPALVDHKEIGALSLYGGALAWAVLTRPSLRQRAGQRSGRARLAPALPGATPPRE